MASIIGSFAASHAPLVARDWHLLKQPLKDRFTAAYAGLGRKVAAANPDVLVVVTPDHWINFFINNLPSVCIGVGESHQGPPEPFLKDFPHKTLQGDPRFARHILDTALADDFEPSISHHLALDHGACIPIWRMNLPRMPRIVPIIINGLEPPMPTIRRCLQWGKLLAKATASYPEPLRVAVLATGGLSHSIGEPTMGKIDEKFDHGCIEAFKKGDDARLLSFLNDKDVDAAGNGSHEVRNWVVAHAAAGSRGFELVDYFPSPEVYVGCGFAAWNVAN
jgi:aromatic ring-opening dioxygenase catalytic subunit (LigB family)